MSNLEQVDAALTEKVIAEDTVFHGRFLRVYRQTVRLPNGCESYREMIRHPGAAAMIALDSRGMIVMERQWRAPAGSAFWEIPAGKIDAGETPEMTARRELKEEAALVAQQWVFLGTIHNAIGYSNEHIEIYLAQNLQASEQSLDENEFLSLHRMPWKDVLEMTRTGEITDVKTIIALNWLRDYLEGNLPQARPVVEA